MEQVDEDMLSWSPGEESNSLVVIVKHLHGNMLSRWTDFLTSDGEKEWRQRDEEFEPDQWNKETLSAKWNEGWKCLFSALENLSDDDLEKTVLIRNEPHKVVEAINRQLTHYSSHVGQIIYLSRMIAGNKWQSLSIQKGKSKEFNRKKFGN